MPPCRHSGRHRAGSNSRPAPREWHPCPPARSTSISSLVVYRRSVASARRDYFASLATTAKKSCRCEARGDDAFSLPCCVGRIAMADSTKRVALYASVGPELTRYEADVEGGPWARRATITLPANVHYAWRHASGRTLYVASSDSASGIGGVVGTKHHVTALRVDPASGALSPPGEPIALPTRPIHMTLDIPSEHILVAFSNPSGLQVYRINPDMTPGAQVAQSEPIDPGIYGHQVRVRLDNRKVILVTRGHDAAGGKPEEPCALKVFDYADGRLTNEVSVAPNGGYGFGPRHLDFHPTRPWVYVSLERQNRLDMVALDKGALSA